VKLPGSKTAGCYMRWIGVVVVDGGGWLISLM